MILGDIDSMTKPTMELYQGMGVKVVVREDDNYTDCEKALVYLEQEVLPEVFKKKDRSVKVVVLGAFGGRMDHTLQNLHLLWKKTLKSPFHGMDYELMMFDNANLTTVLRPGHNTLKLSTHVEGRKGCGIVPLTQCSSITTTGLKYNMGNIGCGSR